MNPIRLTHADALLVVDAQNDFLPGGTLAVPAGDEVVPVLNAYIARFRQSWLPVYASRDWHPSDHCSFAAQGGPWPAHCVAGSAGARFPQSLQLPESATVVSKATFADAEAYSAFHGTSLAEQLRDAGVRRLFIGGLATDYCVLHTVNDALDAGFEAFLLLDAVRAVEVHPGDGQAAIAEMMRRGAQGIRMSDIDQAVHAEPPPNLRRVTQPVKRA